MNLPRVPLESDRPVTVFAVIRVAIVAVTLIALAALDVPDRDSLIVLVAVAAVPLCLAVLLLARSRPALALNPGVALLDLAILAGAELVAPWTYAAVRFLALFLVAAHAHFQGVQRGVAIAIAAVILLVPIAVSGDPPVTGATLAFYETLFAAAAISSGLFMGWLRTAESTGRLRARELSRRVMDAEIRVRRRIAEAIHDGPVQELVSLDMMLDATRRALDRGDIERTRELLSEAGAVAERNIAALRDEMVSLGPYAMDELTLDVALEKCAPVWSRRYGLPVELDIDRVDLPNELCGSLFGIAQEAVANAGRHAAAEHVKVWMRADEEQVTLRVHDDGRGFPADNPFAQEDPGHIGLASMRERAELAGGKLEIDSGEDGTTVMVSAPVSANGASG